MKTIGVVGAGTMGAGIAHVGALNGFPVILQDLTEELLLRARPRIELELRKAVQKGLLPPDGDTQVLERIRSTTSVDALQDCDIVIEAAMEKLDVKRDIFNRLESICRADAVLASNTSSLSITAIASSLKNPGRMCGMHFFNPPHLMKLVEVVRGDATTTETIEQCVALATEMQKTAIVVKDSPGFVVNRVARPYYGEALRILGEGITTVEEIDRIARCAGGFRMGPFELMDLIGIDINFAVTQSMYEQTFGEPRYRPHPIQQQMVSSGRLGRKSGRGFYDYPKT
jgi:3-hydroxybutyryl-CoA dehydrogenase